MNRIPADVLIRVYAGDCQRHAYSLAAVEDPAVRAVYPRCADMALGDHAHRCDQLSNRDRRDAPLCPGCAVWLRRA
ncbi:hypothetical protein [Amycolatopsis sp. CA-230715]|uniref:hypothetical protein n=1 Tax=Amycolatopsis sp. CA-230715 TaxID=2745196 RepID=UPI001C00BC46|nr:hypothetical protein [Amycolatopsis sp. CA-230715]QWF83216.1 hypothetical protein HUW46_06656 [Amycolatopsis sp. CA-230715]